jgi:hypothetical protein
VSAPLIHGKRKPITASLLLEAVADRLSTIRNEDNLRWSDIGGVLHKSEDQAAKYADGSAAMDFIAYARGKLAWGERFTGGVDALLAASHEPVNAHQAQSCVLRAALALAEALEDGELTDAEILANRSTLEKAREAIDAQLSRLGPSGEVAA